MGICICLTPCTHFTASGREKGASWESGPSPPKTKAAGQLASRPQYNQESPSSSETPHPTPPVSPQEANGVLIRSLKVNCKVTSRFAHYVITSQVVNTASEAREVAFDVEIPKTAFISDFAMCVNSA